MGVYLDIGLALGWLRGGLSLGAGLCRAALGRRLGFGRGMFVVPGFRGPAGHCDGELPRWPGAVLCCRPFVYHVNAFVIDTRLPFRETIVVFI